MNLSSYHFSSCHLDRPLLSSGLISRTIGFRIHIKKRRRLKHSTSNLVFSQFRSPFEVNPNLLDSLAPVLGLASGFALYLTKRLFDKASKNQEEVVGEWVFFTSPTPFNRFVLLRCPSILEDVNKKVVKEDRHLVRIDSGSIRSVENKGTQELELEYQRVCVTTEDGGVISLDWPANLDLKEERGLDTTLFLVPGTPQGSMDKSVHSFVSEALNRGLFPVVMNPRGCAGSPLTTARLFTAADSDDICVAVDFINKTRPGTTLMGVGWGYGANMLTKYLAEIGERTPFIAATCIDNPFDLEEATRTSPSRILLDQALTSGLVDILRSNKELFQGRSKGFDVDRALSAKSVREFETAISMVTYGFKDVEDFYSESSTGDVVTKVKIPVLFIQNEQGTVPQFSTPRSLIAENPFTSLLLCVCPSSRAITGEGAAVTWCQKLTIEWLTAVELGLLKGRHPLLKDIDVSINPSDSLALVEDRESYYGGIVEKPLDDTHNVESMKQAVKGSVTASSLQLRSGPDTPDSVNNEQNNGTMPDTRPVESEQVEYDDKASAEDSEKGQVLQTAKIVMNMLDKTMPGTLDEQVKKKVLAAVDRGDTVMKALQDAVPEDVREKLTSAASGIMQAQGTKLNFNGFKFPIGPKNQDQVKDTSNAGELHKDQNSSGEAKMSEDLVNDSSNIQPRVEKPTGGDGAELHHSKSSQESGDSNHSVSDDVSISSQKGSDDDTHRKPENEHLNKEKVPLSSDSGEKTSEPGVQPSNRDVTGDEHKEEHDSVLTQQETKGEETTKDSKIDPSTSTASEDAETSPGSTSGSQMEGDKKDTTKEGNQNSQIEPTMSDSGSPSFSVSQAFGALTGMDDSTQVAVNSVFGVLEEMISKYEEENGEENEGRHKKFDAESAGQQSGGDQVLKREDDSDNDRPDGSKDTHESSLDGESAGQQSGGEQVLKREDDSDNDRPGGSKDIHKNSLDGESAGQQSGGEQVVLKREDDSDNDRPDGSKDTHENSLDSTGQVEEEFIQNSDLVDGNVIRGSQENNQTEVLGLDMETEDQGVHSESVACVSDGHVNRTSSYTTSDSHDDPLHDESMHTDPLNKVASNKPRDVGTTSALFLDYCPEEREWKLKERPEGFVDSVSNVSTSKDENGEVLVSSCKKLGDEGIYIEPPYAIYDADEPHELTEKRKADELKKLANFVKIIIRDSLVVEASRRLSSSSMKEMESQLRGDMEKVANAVSVAVAGDERCTLCFDAKNYSPDCTTVRIGSLHGETVIKAISAAIRSTTYLIRVLPVGVIVGSSLAALRKYFFVAAMHDNGPRNTLAIDQPKSSVTTKHTTEVAPNRGKDEANVGHNGRVMVGSAITAALGASAFLVHQQKNNQKGTSGNSTFSTERGTLEQEEPDKFEEATSAKGQSNIFTSLTEKALSVAAPVVPTKDGQVDQERLVAMLADIGQRGGMLRLVGKMALLWGGIRGAMSLTDRLISFLHLSERCLIQRILGFMGMVLVIWSPTLVPLLPTLVLSWTTGEPSRMAELACIVGLYAAAAILVTLWGKRIRGYENPLEQYGLDFLLSPKKKSQEFFKGLIGGVLVVLLIQSVNTIIGCTSLSWPSIFPSSLDAVSRLKTYGRMTMLASRAVLTATSIVLVEELLFRSWFVEEIAADLGYHRGVIISGLAFALTQRSLSAVPGLWLLSLSLSGLRHLNGGSLSVPIGLRTGIMTSSFVIKSGGFLTYQPSWITGSHPMHPFSGVVGLACALLLAVTFYPRQAMEFKRETKLE